MVNMPVILVLGKLRQEIVADSRTEQPKKKTILSRNQLTWCLGEQSLQRKHGPDWNVGKACFNFLSVLLFPHLTPFPAVPMKGSLSDLSVQSVSNSGCFFQRAKGALLSITAGQKVISKHKNGRFYQCEVVRLTTETFYEVNFDDGSFSDNLYPEDIVVMSGSSWGLGCLSVSSCLTVVSSPSPLVPK